MNATSAAQMWVRSVGIWGAGLDTWPVARLVLRGERELPSQIAPIPPCTLLPAAERRRASKVVNLAMTAALEAVIGGGLDASATPTIFSTSSADGENCMAICKALASADPGDHMISPTRFHHSVHNAAAGYWAISMNSMAPSTSLSAYDGSFAAALLEAHAALATGTPRVLLAAYDVPYPEPLHAKRPIGTSLGIALALDAEPIAGSLARIRVGLSDASADRMTRGELEWIRLASPSGRSLPLLERLAVQAAGTVHLDYLDDLRIAVEVTAP